jgi:hypothetical protein
VGRSGLDTSGSGQGPVVDSCELGNKPDVFHKRWVISWLAERLLASQEEFCYMDSVSQSVSQSAEKTKQQHLQLHGLHRLPRKLAACTSLAQSQTHGDTSYDQVAPQISWCV